MANISIRNLDASVKEALRLRAAEEHCSMEEFLRRCLKKAAYTEDNAKSVYSANDKNTTNNISSSTNKENFSNLTTEQFNNDTVINSQNTDLLASKEAGILQNKNILLIIGGSIAAYKALEFIRLAKRAGAQIQVIMTKAACEFITPLVVGALAGGHVHTELFSRADEHDVGHIRLARQADMVLMFAATASRIAKMVSGQADDLAGAVLLATKAPVMLAPGMNPAMWAHPATQRNLVQLKKDGCTIIEPIKGEMAEANEAGLGRMQEPMTILASIAHKFLALNMQSGLPVDNKIAQNKVAFPLLGKHIIITAGPTQEAFDPVRYVANRSSGKQGYSLAAALAELGARITLVSGPVQLYPPKGVDVINVVSAREMQKAVQAALPADAAIFVAAVADWRPENIAEDKIKKPKIQISQTHKNDSKSAADKDWHNNGHINMGFVENPDILAEIGHDAKRPSLVIGFAAETTDLIHNASGKLKKKGADWIIANNVSKNGNKPSVMGGDNNQITILTQEGTEIWSEMPKTELSHHLAHRIKNALCHK